ncbi:hypothetical protein KG892_01620 [Vermiphilus pyriformis]|nr:MAG: hypothetical protein KG892_01620 [Vermiphilus pyriformis]
MKYIICKRIYMAMSLIFIICIGYTATSNTCDTAPRLNTKNIGLLVVATGNYKNFIPQLLDSARKYFCTTHKVTFFIFSDSFTSQAIDTVIIPIQKLASHYDSALRSLHYINSANLYKNMDYIFACDADTAFVDVVGDEILGDLTLVQNTNGSFNKRFFGGNSVNFLALCDNIARNVEQRILLATVDKNCEDECFNNTVSLLQPTRILPPAYYAPQNACPYRIHARSCVK